MPGWTGGQYSLFRVLLGIYLTAHFSMLIPWGAELFSAEGVLPDGSVSPLLHAFPNVLALIDAPWFVTALLVSSVAAALLFAAGRFDRMAAVWMWYVLACLFGRNPLISNPSLPYVGLLLLVHTAVAPAPYGSWAAKGRIDPAGGWFLDRRLWGVAWALMAIGYTYSGYTKLVSPSWQDGTALARVLNNPLARSWFLTEWASATPIFLLKVATWGGLALELLFAPLALLRQVRPWIWGLMVALHLSLLVLVDFADLTLGMLILHAFTFDPRWVRPRTASESEWLFYDGECGLCHGFVRFLLSEDERGAFRFSPLQGAMLPRLVSENQRKTLPDSLVLRSASGELLLRSDGVVHILRRLGGAWRVAGELLRLVPRPIRDTGYRFVAAVRKSVFPQPSGACPILPQRLSDRFEP